MRLGGRRKFGVGTVENKQGFRSHSVELEVFSRAAYGPKHFWPSHFCVRNAPVATTHPDTAVGLNSRAAALVGCTPRVWLDSDGLVHSVQAFLSL